MGIADDLQGLARRLVEPLKGYLAVAPIAFDFTPGIAGSSTAGAFTYNIPLTKGRCIRSGPLVDIWGRVIITGITTAPSGALVIINLPFIPRTNAYLPYGSGFGLVQNYNYQSGIQLSSYPEAPGSRIIVAEIRDNNTMEFNTAAGVTTTLDISFWARYEAE
jgi:hypothetical protein